LESRHCIAPRRFERVWQSAWICCFAIIAWLSLLMLPRVPVAPELDLSWAGALPYFAHRGFRFGTDVIFTYGPLGHFAGFAYTGYLTTERTLWEFVMKGLATALFCWALRELRPVIRVALAVCIILLLGNYEEAYAFTIALTGLMLLVSPERRFWIHVLLGLFLAVLALVKFNYLVQGTCAVGSAIGYYMFRRRWIALVSLTASFAVGLLACWGLAEQTLGDFPRYIGNSLAMTSGYNAAMFMPTANTPVVWIAAFTSILLILLLALFWVDAQDKARLTFGSIFLILILFFLWKHAFTRWENHAQKFFLLFPELLLASWLLASKNRLNRWGLALTCVAIMSALVGLAILEKGTLSPVVVRACDQFRLACSFVTGYAQFDEGRRAGLAEAKNKFYLPRIKAVVADRMVDVFGYRQGIAILNGLNYVPRPIFQGYSAYTPSLIELNTQYYQSVKRPEFVISKLETIDHRFPTLDDSGVLLELLYHYRPILSENGWQLWETAHPAQALQPQLIAKLSAKLGQYVSIPENVFIWIELELKKTHWGRIATFFYKSAPIFIELEDDRGQNFRYRIVPSMASSGWLLNPELTNDDQLALAAHGAPLQRYKWLRIAAEPGGGRFFKKTVEIKFSALPDIGHLPLDASPQR
jgi:hypothetical protein